MDNTIYVQWSDDGQHIRKYSRDPFDGAETFHQSDTGAALTREGREALREALAEAYRKGATDVHSYWVNNPGEPPQGDPEFGEAASDYAMSALDPFDSSARAALAQPVEAGEDGEARIAEIKAHVERYDVGSDARRVYSTAQLETAIRLALSKSDAGEKKP